MRKIVPTYKDTAVIPMDAFPTDEELKAAAKILQIEEFHNKVPSIGRVMRNHEAWVGYKISNNMREEQYDVEGSFDITKLSLVDVDNEPFPLMDYYAYRMDAVLGQLADEGGA